MNDLQQKTFTGLFLWIKTMKLNSILDGVQSAQGIINSINGLFTGGAGSWWETIQPASFKGMPFGVFQTDIQFGRRNALHEYPYKETVWVEDMGRATRKLTFSAFLLEDDRVYGGGSVIGQLESFITACESEDEGELVHPLLGRMNVSLMEASAVAKSDSGRMIELNLSFVESDKRNFPASIVDAGAIVEGLLEQANEAVKSDFLTKAIASLKKGGGAVKEVIDQAAKWAAIASKVINNASRIYHTVRNIPGAFGRYGLAGVARSIQSVSTSTKNILALRVQTIKHLEERKKEVIDAAAKVSV